MKRGVLNFLVVLLICFFVSHIFYEINPELADNIGETVMKRLGYSEQKIYNSATGFYLIGASIVFIGPPLFVGSFFIKKGFIKRKVLKNVLPFISVTIVTLFFTTLITAPFGWSMDQLLSMYAKIALFNFIIISVMPSTDNFFGRLKNVIEIPLIYGTCLYFSLGLFLWFAGGLFSMIFTLDRTNWAGDSPATIYAFTNAWIYLLAILLIAIIIKIIEYLFTVSSSLSLLDIDVDFSDVDSVKDFIGHPVGVLTLAIMTLHRFIFYAGMNPLFEGILHRGWGLYS